ncbi:efflux transporter outer membrane subunit [Zhouia sp. PK063]|uniref:efflux transporter outer membrane subunit n=1 Tax=Zhouia sp. PK063 TaxID=3373602 RepID=UPI0037A4ED9C
MKTSNKYIQHIRKPKSWVKMGALTLLASVLITGCKVGQPYQRPEFKNINNTFYRDSTSVDSVSYNEEADTIKMSEIPWKTYIKDTLLKSFIDTALVNNIDLQKAMKNMDITMEELAQSNANFLPSLNATPMGYRREYYSENYNNYGSNRARRNHDENPPTSLYTERLEYTAALQSSWEIDLWGKLRWKKEAARAELMKSNEFKKAVQTALIANVASTYYNLLMLKAQIAVAEQTLKLNSSTLKMVKLQYDAGETTSLAVQQTTSQQLKSKTLIPQLKREYTVLENKLNALMGRSPQHLTINTSLEEVTFQDHYNTGVPLELIKNRPDVALTEYALIASNAKTGVAEALKYPSLTIDAGIGLNSYKLDKFLNPVSSAFALLNGALFQPIFNNRKLKTNYRIAVKQREIAQLDFKNKLINAIGDVSNNLATIQNLQEEYEIAQERIQVTRKGIKDANLLFRGGFANYLEVNTAQNDALESELNLIKIRKQLLIANVELYRSLGGGWK